MSLELRLIAALAAAAIALGGWVYVRHLQASVTALKAQNAVLEQQAGLNTTAGQIVERTLTRETTIIKNAEASVDAVQSLPGADTALDPAFASGLRAELERMRPQPDPSGDPDIRGPARALPKADP